MEQKTNSALGFEGCSNSHTNVLKSGVRLLQTYIWHTMASMPVDINSILRSVFFSCSAPYPARLGDFPAFGCDAGKGAGEWLSSLKHGPSSRQRRNLMGRPLKRIGEEGLSVFQLEDLGVISSRMPVFAGHSLPGCTAAASPAKGSQEAREETKTQ